MNLLSALAQLLHNGKLRDEFAVDSVVVAERLGVQGADRASFLAMPLADLEAQAEVLLRKRFDAVKHLLPLTVMKLNGNGWPLFLRYARDHWPEGEQREESDAAEFCQYCVRENSGPICRSELNRMNFANSKRPFAIHFTTDISIENRRRAGLQIFYRQPLMARWREAVLYLSL